MENVILCSGSYALHPYYLEQDDLHLYSIEELCYYLYKNAYLIEEDFFSDQLFDWMSQELGLIEWVQQLRIMRQKDPDILRTMEVLFRLTGYYSNEEIRQVRTVFLESHGLSPAERRKLRADSYCNKKKYAMAMAEYEQLLREADEEQVKFRAKLYHNLGVCSAGLFLYEKAADYFQKAFQVYPNTESYVQFLMALKLGNSREKYLTYLSEHPESYEDSLEVENRLARVEREWNEHSFDDAMQNLMDHNGLSYYETLKQLLKQAKTDYTGMVNLR